jgi:hypothetical protein
MAITIMVLKAVSGLGSLMKRRIECYNLICILGVFMIWA